MNILSHYVYPRDRRKIPTQFWRKYLQSICKKPQNGPFAYFFRNFLGETTPPLLRENKKPPLLGSIWSSTAKVKIFPHHVYRQSEIWRQNYTHFIWEINMNYAKKGLEYTICINYPKKKIRGNPEPPTLLREDKNSLLGFIWSSKAEVSILPHHVYRSFEGKNYTQFWRRNQHELRKKKKEWAHNASFASIFQKCSRGRPRAPNCSRGIHSRTFPQAAIRADMVTPSPPPP